jgi:hypothetical protein
VSPRPGARLRQHPLLLALTIVGPLCEAVPLRYFGVTAGLAPQVTAPLAFGVFHDLRWIAVFHNSWWAFAGELVAMVVVRTTFIAATVRAAWPRSVAPPSWKEALQAALGFTLVAIVVLWPWAALVFAAGATSLEWLQFTAIPPFLLFAMLLSHGGVRSDWWAQWPTARSVGWTLLTFVQLNLASAAIVLGPWWTAWCSAALSGLFNAWAWHGMVGAAAERQHPVRLRPVQPIALLTLFALVIGGVALRFEWHGHEVDPPAAIVDPRGRVPILVAHGFDSSWDGQRAEQRFGDRYLASVFSYAGLGADGQPQAYEGTDTHESVARLAALMNLQVRALYRSTGERVRIVAVSEGGVVARTFVQTHPRAPVDELVLASPLVEPGRVYYPPRGHEGWGVATGWGLRAVTEVLSHISPIDTSPDAPFLRSIVDHAPAFRTGMLCPVPHTEFVAVLPLASVAAIPPVGAGPEVPMRVVATFHGDDLGAALDIAAGDGRVHDLSTSARVVNRLLRASATAWMVPELPVALNPAWTAPVRDGEDCPVSGWPGQR